jgi:amino-acid N-acetyltransferase
MNIFAHPSKESVLRILTDAKLPTSDITEEKLGCFFGCGPELEPEGVVGIEVYGEFALLRSLAVVPARQGAGRGAALVERAEQSALRRGVRSVYLLTTTAETFFERLGYAFLSRDEAPLPIRNNKEFSSICPASSAFMVKHLRANPALHPTAQTARRA